MADRYFVNPYQDYTAALFVRNDKKFKSFIISLIHKYVSLILEHTSPKVTRSDQRSDIYVGTSGIAFMFLKLSKSIVRDEFPDSDGLAKEYSNCATHALNLSGARKDISLLSGNAGVNVISAAVKNSIGESFDDDIKKLLHGVSIFDNPAYLDDGADEMLVGRCGFMLGLLWLNRQLEEAIISGNELKRLATVIIKSGRAYSNRHKLKTPLMYQYHGREYLGAAHGISAIIFTLLMVPLLEKEVAEVQVSIDTILDLQDESGNFPSKFNNSDAHLVQWCHGAPGIVFLMAKAYKTFGSQKYLDSCIKCGDLVWQKGLLRKGPGICHGVAGNGYVHLLLYRLTGDDKHLYRAMKFAEFLECKTFIKEARTPDRPFSLYEGLAGTVCYLIDLLQPDNAEFPFMNVFD